MFQCIQRFGSLIVPTVRLSFRIVPLFSVIESDSLSIRTGTNRQGKELFVMAVRSASGDTLPGNLTIIPSGQKWVFHSIYKYAFPLLYSVQVCSRNRLVLTDEDPSEYSPMENLIITENHFKKSNMDALIDRGLLDPKHRGIRGYILLVRKILELEIHRKN